MNWKKVRMISIIIMSSILVSACGIPYINVTRGSGVITTQNREVGGFDSVQVDGAGQIIILQGEEESLEIQAEDNIIDRLTSEVQGNTLVLGYRDSVWRNSIIPTKRIIYTLTIDDLSEITINGAADLEIDSLETGALALTINGAGQVTIDQLSAESLNVKIAGTTDMTIAGQVTQQLVSIEGAGNYKAGDLQTSTTSIEIDGLGSATVWASENLDISIDGGGNLRYYGSPNVTQEINGFGDIDNLGEK